MFARKTALAIALAASVLVGTSGCSLTQNVATGQQYSPADGTQATVGDLGIRNAYILVNNGKAALFGSIVNSGLKSIDGAVQYTDITSAHFDESFTIKPGEKIDFGYNGSLPLILNVDASKVLPGANVLMSLKNTVDNPVSFSVPVLDATEPLYADLAAEIQ